MTTILEQGQSWRWGFVVGGGLQLLLVAGFCLTRDHWRMSETPLEAGHPDVPFDALGAIDTLRQTVVCLSIAMFLLAAGIQASAGQWPYSLFVEARSVAPKTAGFWVSVFWASTTAGRIGLALLSDRVQATPLLRSSMLAVVGGAALMWWNVSDALGFLGLALMGLGYAAVFPALFKSTPDRVGSAHAANAIGFMIAGSSVGLAALPALAGLLARRAGLEAIGPFLFVGAAATFAVHEVIVRRTPLATYRATGQPATDVTADED
jgi:fucose permease